MANLCFESIDGTIKYQTGLLAAPRTAIWVVDWASMKTAPELFDLTGRVALVTGGSRGLGKAIVLGLAQAGADVVITSRTLDACEAVAAEVERTTGRQTLAHACDVGNWSDLEGLVEASYARFGKVDVLINNAGGSMRYSSIGTITEALVDKVLALNLKGPLRLCTLVGERMVAAGGGSIVNVSSASARHPRPEYMPYSAAKAGLTAMTMAFARAYAPTVRVNSIAPGPFLTEGISSGSDMEALRDKVARHALKRFGRPDEIVGAAIYLASDASTYTTGVCLEVHGGED
jgi:NAD(P)-dependent dehydrogenase (short-subunit alcohol dehydrogenase family)